MCSVVQNLAISSPQERRCTVFILVFPAFLTKSQGSKTRRLMISATGLELPVRKNADLMKYMKKCRKYIFKLHFFNPQWLWSDGGDFRAAGNWPLWEHVLACVRPPYSAHAASRDGKVQPQATLCSICTSSLKSPQKLGPFWTAPGVWAGCRPTTLRWPHTIHTWTAPHMWTAHQAAVSWLHPDWPKGSLGTHPINQKV